LPPGDYRFRVKAANSDGVWNETGTSLAFVVLPAWYQTWLFRGLVILTGIGGIASVVRKRVRALEHRRAAQELFSRRLLESQEAERKRIAAELHDGLGQNLLVIKNRVQMARQPGTAVETELDEISRLAAQSLQEVRDISQNLRPYQLDRLGLTRALQAVVKRVSASATLKITTNIIPVDRLFPSEAETNLFRILQEALNNILKHSRATEARVEVKQDDSQVQLMVEDNGRGFVWPLKEGERPHGMGLSGIAERVRILGGRLEINSTPGRGTRLKITVPIPKDGK
jgi:signal transduction histidine kinase